MQRLTVSLLLCLAAALCAPLVASQADSSSDVDMQTLLNQVTQMAATLQQKEQQEVVASEAESVSAMPMEVEAAGSMKCLNGAGQAVDWWVMLKSNMDSSSSDSLMQAGTRYFYADSTSYTKFTSPSTGLDSATSPLGRTVSQVYSNSAQGYVFYNDEEPDGSTSTSKAHAKGVIGFTSSGGFWLVHSMPRFATAPPAKYSLPASGLIYGQSYICLSLSLAQLDDVGSQLQIYNPQVYGSNMPSSLASKMSNMNDFIGGTVVKDATSNVITLSVGGSSFIHFAKNAKWNQDLYSVLVAPHFKTPLACETWMRPLEPAYYDTTYAVVNVNSVNVLDYSWTEPQDHSKWAVSLSSSKPVVCIGDINRQKTQWKRGGGTVCLSDKKLFNLFSSVVGSEDPATSKAAVLSIAQPTSNAYSASGSTQFVLLVTLFNVLITVVYLFA